ncbi:hypothetical protein HWV62_1791 [Athelia sp. TMB]|nr:hypothetical protein HWV62_1791 [Athelia sp. TMB]
MNLEPLRDSLDTLVLADIPPDPWQRDIKLNGDSLVAIHRESASRGCLKNIYKTALEATLFGVNVVIQGALLHGVDPTGDIPATFFILLGSPGVSPTSYELYPTLLLLGYGGMLSGSGNALETIIPLFKTVTPNLGFSYVILSLIVYRQAGQDTPGWLDGYLLHEEPGHGGALRNACGPYGEANFYQGLSFLPRETDIKIGEYASGTWTSPWREDDEQAYEDLYPPTLAHGDDNYNPQEYDFGLQEQTFDEPAAATSSSKDVLYFASLDDRPNKRPRAASTSSVASASSLSESELASFMKSLMAKSRDLIYHFLIDEPGNGFDTPLDKTLFLKAVVNRALKNDNITLPKGQQVIRIQLGLKISQYASHVLNIIWDMFGIAGDNPICYVPPQGAPLKTAQDISDFIQASLTPSLLHPSLPVFTQGYVLEDTVGKSKENSFTSILMLRSVSRVLDLQVRSSNAPPPFRVIRDTDIDSTTLFIHKALCKLGRDTHIPESSLVAWAPPKSTRVQRLEYVRSELAANPCINQAYNDLFALPP